ncbi:hypothetical protein [Tsukamurella tyrosinosolvens]|uniref:hypothetical protein n=1 Tax=Tsukamurella tyrosinosolvens TaxID=57704 RepID=UPI002F942580
MTNPGDDAQPLDSDPTTAAAEPIDAEIVDLPPSGPVAPSYEEVTGYTTSGVPTFDHVREKIERRTTTALGAEELAHGTTAGRTPHAPSRSGRRPRRRSSTRSDGPSARPLRPRTRREVAAARQARLPDRYSA